MDLWLPVIFAGLMALAMFIYVVLHGYDHGVGTIPRERLDDPLRQPQPAGA